MNEVLRSTLVAAVLTAIAAALFLMTPGPASRARAPVTAAQVRAP